MSQALVDRLQQEFGDRILGTVTHRGDETVKVSPTDLLPVLEHLKKNEACELLLDVVGNDFPEREQRFEVTYLLRSISRKQKVHVKVAAGEGDEVPSAVGLYRSADWAEREVYDLYGVRFRNHPNLKRILTHHEFEGHALRKDYPIERGQWLSTPEHLYDDEAIRIAVSHADAAANGGPTEVEIHPSDYLTVNIGPSHPAMHGALRVEALLDGETIVDSRTEIGYLHRCFEKEAEDHTWAEIMPYTDRLNYCSALTNNVIYAAAVEKLIGVEIPPRGQAIRVIVGELGRIIDHLVCVCANLVDLGALTNYWYMYNVREGIYLDIIEKLCGSRLTTNYARIGGLSHDVFDGFEDAVRHHLGKLDEALKDVIGLVSRNRIYLDRTIGAGAVTTEDALSWGYTGPCLRATGFEYDVRKHSPYSGYEQYDFEIPTGTNGDTHDRITCRIAEMFQSSRIIRQALDRLPTGPIRVDNPSVILPPKKKVYGSIEGVMNQFKLVYEGIQVPEGEAYGFGEGANGELGFFCVSDGTGRPQRMKVRPPCFPIFSSFGTIVRGQMIPDAVAVLGSLNIVAGELDR